MNMFARFNENPAMILQDIKETKRYRRTDARTHGRTTWKQYTPYKQSLRGGIINISDSNFLSSSYGNALKKVWGMENIPHWIWPVSRNWLDEIKRKWAGHGLSKCCIDFDVLIIPDQFKY